MPGSINKARPASPPAVDLEAEIARISAMSVIELRAEWRQRYGSNPPTGLTKDLIARALAYRLQEKLFGGISRRTLRCLRDLKTGASEPVRQVKVGSIIVREFQGVLHEVLVVPGGFCWQGRTYDSLSTIAKAITGTNWNGPRFFGLRAKRDRTEANTKVAVDVSHAGRRSSVSALKTIAMGGQAAHSKTGSVSAEAIP